jgi:hypothetical protein
MMPKSSFQQQKLEQFALNKSISGSNFFIGMTQTGINTICHFFKDNCRKKLGTFENTENRSSFFGIVVIKNDVTLNRWLLELGRRVTGFRQA